ncbi:MAG: Na/Pi cotransporter family protein, partial [Lachnospiraceae bacterium]|nr:Na/Pi cotransporter family protein [Lachnospiraceae bacterium]
MDFYSVTSLLGGLGLFIYGMEMLGDGLEKVAGNKLKLIIEKLTTNKIVGFFVGCLVTCIIQSSSATTVMVVGFVNTGLMNLSQAVGVILGANVGTTITAQLIAFKLTKIAPVFAFFGLLLMMGKSKKKKKMYDWGYLLFGFAVLFIGMNIMSDSVKPLGNSEIFKNMMTSFENPVVGILIGLFVTSVIQSSSVSIGLLQALAVAGLVTLKNSMFLVMGMNIGTCVTALLASINCGTSAKRVASIHFLQKLIASIVFLVLMMFVPVGTI